MALMMYELMPRAARESKPKIAKKFYFALIYKPGSIFLILTHLGKFLNVMCGEVGGTI